MNDILLINITWNPFGWKNNTYINPKAGHGYAKRNVGGESLNFNFNKRAVDTDTSVFGYSQWTNSPNKFSNGGLIIFYTRNTDENKGQIVGIYGNAEILHFISEFQVPFQNETYYATLKAEKDLSLLFPIPLDANDFKNKSSDRMVGQIGFTYKDIGFAEKVISRELNELFEVGNSEFEYQKLLNIYEIYIGKKFKKPFISNDEKEQNELQSIFNKMSKTELLDYINNLNDSDPKEVIVKRKTYKRNNKTIALIKILRNYKCQICSGTIKKKDGNNYIEAAHIKPKHQKGIEKPENIILLCPNHHKEFDLGDLEIMTHDSQKIHFKLNGINHQISLTFE